MKINSSIVEQAADHVSALLEKKLRKSYCYHDLSHTQYVVKAVNKIAEGMKLSDHEKYVLNVAAWFHDVGYTVQIDEHERIAAGMALNFLQDRKVDKEDIWQVRACIMATKYPQQPSSTLECIICDADMLHLGKKNYFKKADLIRGEWELTKNEELNDRQWYSLNIRFLREHKFHTKFCQDKYNRRKDKNIERVSTILINGNEAK